MSLLERTPGLLEALRGEMTPKFLATRSPAGTPNVVPVISIQPSEHEAETLFFGNFLLRKTVRNLDADTRVGVMVITPALQGWALTGDFVEWQRTGPYVERQLNSGLLRYNAYTGVRNAGVIRVRSVDYAFSLSRLRVARDFLLARHAARDQDAGGAPGDGTVVPRPVQIEYARMVAVKILAWIGDSGYPFVAPAMSLQPASQTRFVCCPVAGLPQPPSGAPVAANVLTTEAVSYQVKGRWAHQGHIGSVRVEEVYAGGPPIPGGRVA